MWFPQLQSWFHFRFLLLYMKLLIKICNHVSKQKRLLWQQLYQSHKSFKHTPNRPQQTILVWPILVPTRDLQAQNHCSLPREVHALKGDLHFHLVRTRNSLDLSIAPKCFIQMLMKLSGKGKKKKEFLIYKNVNNYQRKPCNCIKAQRPSTSSYFLECRRLELRKAIKLLNTSF